MKKITLEVEEWELEAMEEISKSFEENVSPKGMAEISLAMGLSNLLKAARERRENQ